MRKILTFLFAALMSVGMWAETVTWDSSDIPASGESKDGITITYSGFNDEDGISIYGPGTFTSSIGNFTKIVVSADDPAVDGAGWKAGDRWNGLATSVSFSGNMNGLFSIEFTFEEPAPEPIPMPASIPVTEINVPESWKDIYELWTASDMPGFTATSTAKAQAIASDILAVDPAFNCFLIYGFEGNNVLYIDAYDSWRSSYSYDFVKNYLWARRYNTGYRIYYTTRFDITANLDPQNAGVYYSTFYHGSVDYALPANVTAYKATISGDDLLLSEVAAEGDVLPKGNAVILRSSEQNYSLTLSDATPVSVGDDNDLEGVDAEKAVTAIDGLTTENCYVLSGTNENGVGFYRINSDNLKAHKAYVKFSGSNGPKRMRFVFNTTTGVESAQPSVISGQKLIENGQLIIIKNGVRYNAQGQIVK